MNYLHFYRVITSNQVILASSLSVRCNMKLAWGCSVAGKVVIQVNKFRTMAQPISHRDRSRAQFLATFSSFF